MKPIIICGLIVSSLFSLSVKAQSSKVVLDNEHLKVTEYTSQPGKDVCGAGKHTHGDHATILLTDARVKTTNADGSISLETYSTGKQLYTVTKNGKTEQIPTNGSFWVPGATHSVINNGNKPLRFYIIETKK